MTCKKILVGIILLCNAAFAQDQSEIIANHDADQCIQHINRIRLPKDNQESFKELYSDLTHETTFKNGVLESKKLCKNQKIFISDKMQNFDKILYSNLGISVDDVGKIYSQGFDHLSKLKEKQISKSITQDQVCDQIFNDDYIQATDRIDGVVYQAIETCNLLEKSGFNCGPNISKENYYNFLEKLQPIASRLNAIDPTSFADTDEAQLGVLADFFNYQNPSIQTRIHDLLPKKEPSLKITSIPIGNDNVTDIHFTYEKDKSFSKNQNWEVFSKQFKHSIETFWQGSFRDQNNKKSAFKVSVDEATSELNPAKVWKIGITDGPAEGMTDRQNRYVIFKPYGIKGDVSTWLHEFGHVLGFGEAYGAWLDSNTEECRIGLFNDMTNVMNNTATNTGNAIPKLQLNQIQQIIEAYTLQSDSNIDQKIDEKFDEVYSISLSIFKKKEASESNKHH